MTPEKSLTPNGLPTIRGREDFENSAHQKNSLIEHKPNHRWLITMVCLLLTTIIWAVFGQTRHFEFTNYDDPHYVFENPVFNQGLKWPAIVWSFTHQNEHEWFPVTYVSRMIDFELYGANAGGHHLTNVLLHIATTVMLFLVLRRMTGRLWLAAFVAAVFAVHPLRVESVAWVVERKDVLSGLFFMLTLWKWLDYLEDRFIARKSVDNSGSYLRHWYLSYFMTLIFFSLGLLSKSMIVTLPCVLLLLDFWPLKRLPTGGLASVGSEFRLWLGLILEKIPLFVLSAASCVTTALTETNVMSASQHLSLFWRIGNELIAYVVYLQHTICPIGLALVYPHSEANPSFASVCLAGGIMVTISMIVLARWRKHPYLLVGWLWFVGMFLPVILTMQSTQNARADRYTYLPQIGLLIMLTWGCVEFCSAWRHRRIVLGSAASIILIGLLAAAYVQTAYWKDSVTVWTRTVTVTSENYFAENSLGSALNNQGKWDEAVQHLRRSLQFKPDNIETHINLGVALMNQGKPAEAVSQFEQTLQINPNSIQAHYYLGDALVSEDKLDEGIAHYEQALQYRPDYSDDHFSYTEAHYGLGIALAHQHKWAEAVPHLEQALHLKLDETDARYILATKFAARQKWTDAMSLYQEVLQRKPDFAEAQNNYGIALISTGKTTEATEHFQNALALATAQGNTTLAEAILTRLKSISSP